MKLLGEGLWAITILITICILAVIYRLVYIRAYRAGAMKVLAEWKETLKGDGSNENV